LPGEGWHEDSKGRRRRKQIRSTTKEKSGRGAVAKEVSCRISLVEPSFSVALKITDVIFGAGATAVAFLQR
jgi:hypothetical protein